jgi:hypothetical protein
VIVKKLVSVAALAFFAASSLAAAQNSNTTPMKEASLPNHAQQRLGNELVASLRQAYETGSYDAFLANLHADYQNLIQSGKFAEFVKMREMPPVDEKLTQLSQHWEDMHQKIVDERNAALLASIAGKEDQILAQRIQSATKQMAPEQKEALHYLASLRFKTPEKAANEDEKKLIEIDLASEFKLVHMDMQFAQKPFEDRIEKHLVINMDMIKQMSEAAKSFKDSALKKKVEIAAAVYDAWQSRNWDLNKLNHIAKKPVGDFEKKIAEIMKSYQAKKEDLYQKEFLAKLDQ